MANTLTGKFIAVSDKQTITGKESTIVKRQVLIDCTRFDPYTGERGYENTPLLEFSHKGLERLESLLGQGLKKGDVITVSFDVQGTSYEKDGRKQIFTSIRPYNVEMVKKASDTAEPAPPAPAAPPAPDTTNVANNDLPF